MHFISFSLPPKGTLLSVVAGSDHNFRGIIHEFSWNSQRNRLDLPYLYFFKMILGNVHQREIKSFQPPIASFFSASKGKN
jgi:hypothetical protein